MVLDLEFCLLIGMLLVFYLFMILKPKLGTTGPLYTPWYLSIFDLFILKVGSGKFFCRVDNNVVDCCTDQVI